VACGNCGAVVSWMVIVWVACAVWPWESVVVQVMVWLPIV